MNFETGDIVQMYKRLSELREDSDFTQQQIADILQIHKITYHNYETGKRELPLNVAILLAKHYNVSLDYLAGLSDKP